MNKFDLALVSDFYEFTMSNVYFENGMTDQIVYFDVFFRKIPENGGYAIFAGLEQVIDYVKNLSFSKKDIDFFRNTNKTNYTKVRYS